MDLYQQHTKNIHKYNLREMVFWGEMCVFFLSDNHVKLEMKKNSVTGSRNFII